MNTNGSNQAEIRNFCIIAHIDHGKSTLADRMLELTGTVSRRDMRAQVLDTMDLEQERGITIKLQPVTMEWRGYVLNLIDTPGHADFGYEVDRTLAACEGAILLVDASQGVQAQTIATVERAVAHGLEIIPVAGKTDLAAADPEGTATEIEQVLGLPADRVLRASGKTGDGVEAVLAAIIDRIPAPSGDPGGKLRALVFDSRFDSFRGVVASVRVVDGHLTARQPIRLMAGKAKSEAGEVGWFRPQPTPSDALGAGQVGYIVTGLKDIAQVRVGDTVTHADDPAAEPLPGYAEVLPMVFAGLFAEDGSEFEKLRESLGKLSLNDASLTYEPAASASLGMGFRAGFLGLLHLDIVRERLRREYDLDVVVTSPTVPYEVARTDGRKTRVSDPAELPDPTKIAEIREPWAAVEVVARQRDIGAVQKLIAERRGAFTGTRHLGTDRVVVAAEVPLAALVADFYDVLKGTTAGYGSLSYQVREFRPGDLVRLDFLVAGDPVEALSVIVHRSEVQSRARAVLGKLKELIPRELFQIALQAVIGGKIVARENISPTGKKVTAGLYGGDVTRKRKVLEKQKKGKQRLKAQGRVRIPPEAFTAVLGK